MIKNNKTYNKNLLFNLIVYHDKSIEDDLQTIVKYRNWGGIQPNTTCSDEVINNLYTKSDFKDNVNFKCFNQQYIFPQFVTAFPQYEAIWFGFTHKCLPENNCSVPKEKFKIGYRLNHTKINFNKYEDFLENIEVREDFFEEISNFPYSFFFFQYSTIKNDVGVFTDIYEEYNYLNAIRNQIWKSGQWFPKGTMEMFLVMEDAFIIYTRRYMHLTTVIRESFLILVLIASIFKFISLFYSNYCCEQYLINFFNDLGLLEKSKQIIEENKLEDNCVHNNENSIIPFKNLNGVEIEKHQKVNCKEINVSSNKTYKSYNLRLVDFAFADIPVLSYFVDKEYLNYKDKMDELLSIENLIK